MTKAGNLFKVALWLLFPITITIILILKTKIFKSEMKPTDAIAENQYSAMRDYGTDEKSLFNSLVGLNKEELQKVYNSFGLRTYTTGGQGIEILGVPIIGKKLDLFGWYSAEIENEDEKEFLRNTWKKSGLKLTF